MFGEKILNYWDDIINDCKNLIAIPSVASEPDGIYPYGKNCANAVDFVMDLAEKYSLKAKNIDYYACHAEIGQGDENAVVMAHIDVVPEGEGWTGEPFKMDIRDGNIYGRGIADDKGPAIVALHCLRALRDEGVIGKRKLRVVLGSGEEVGMRDMEYYFAKEQTPTIGFTPDSAYGLCNCEKGHITFTVSCPNNSKILRNFTAGTVVNAVPYKATATVICSDDEYINLQNFANKSEGEFEFINKNGELEIFSKGSAAHASLPELGKNAASYLIDLLYNVFGNKIGTALLFAQEKVGLTYDGSLFQMKCSDEISGDLTLNLGIVKISENNSELAIDIRFPKDKKSEDFTKLIDNAVIDYNFSLDKISCSEALYVPADSSLVKMLSESYENATGEKCDVFSMGGGTYAKAMAGKGVSFGPSFADDETRIHDFDEKINLENFKIHAQICLEAMYKMFTNEI